MQTAPEASHSGPIVLTAAIGADRRRHKRIEADLKGRYLGPDGDEHVCEIENISAGGALVRAAHPPQKGARVVIYFNDLGRFDSQVVRTEDDGFAVRFKCGAAKLDKTADALTWLQNRKICPSIDGRRHVRARRDEDATLYLDSGQAVACRVLDISLSGASLAISPAPPIGAAVMLGRTSARVVRVHDAGVGIEFLNVAHAAPPLVRG